MRSLWARLRAELRRRWKLSVAISVLVLAGLGGVIFVFVGGNQKESFHLQAAIPASGQPFAHALYQSLGVRMLPGHEVSLIDNGKVFDAIVEDAARARTSIHVLMYIWEKGAASERITASLIGRAKAGVACRVLVDAFGSPDFVEDLQGPLVRGGCEVRLFRPSPQDELARNHRKIVVFDGEVAITGGFGIRDNWLGDGVHGEGWRDSNVRFSGAAVSDAQQSFAENWQEAGGALLPSAAFPTVASRGTASAAFVSSTGSPILTRAERLTQLMIAAAKKRIWIANAYFVPSKAILDLLMRKVSEGADVRILAPGKRSDSKTTFGVQQFEYDSLIARGVRVWEYQPSMLHSKTILVDDRLVLVGSINLEPLSLTKLDEAALLVEEPDLAQQLALKFTKDCQHANELLNR